jgi:hypothetical protein
MLSSLHCHHPTSHLLDEVNAGLQVKAKVDEDPVDSLTLVLFLLQHEHVLVKELLQLLIGEVDAQLLKAVKLQEDSAWLSRH